MDEATLAANGHDYLDLHLRDMVETIERETVAQLAAIGIGIDVSPFYVNATRVATIDELGPALTQQARHAAGRAGAPAEAVEPAAFGTSRATARRLSPRGNQPLPSAGSDQRRAEPGRPGPVRRLRGAAIDCRFRAQGGWGGAFAKFDADIVQSDVVDARGRQAA